MQVKNYLDFTGKCAVVTGASKGLGQAFALALADAGANVVISCRHEEELNDTKRQIEAKGGNVHTMQADITSESDMAALMKGAEATFGRLDILVNNAATSRINKSPSETTLEEWNKVIDTNVTGMFLCAREAGKIMKKQKRGKIVNLCSISGFIVNKYFHGGSYEVSKSAVAMLTKTLAIEWADYNIQVNAVAPGYYETKPNLDFFGQNPELEKKILDMIPLRRFGNKEELAGLIVCLCSDISNYMTGTVIKIDGGYSLW